MSKRYDAERQRWVDDGAAGPAEARGTDTAPATWSRQQVTLAGAGALVLACGGVGLGLWLGLRGDDKPAEQPRPSATSAHTQAESRMPSSAAPSASGRGPSSAIPSASAAEPAPPPTGFRRTADPAGFTVDVPVGWQRREVQGKSAAVVFYENADASRQLQLFWVEDSSPYESVRLADQDNSGRLRGYERLALERFDDGARPAARREYTYASEEHGGTRHVLDHRFQAEDGELYAVLAIGPGAGESAEEHRLLQTAVDSFCPAGATEQCEWGAR